MNYKRKLFLGAMVGLTIVIIVIWWVRRPAEDRNLEPIAASTPDGAPPPTSSGDKRNATRKTAATGNSTATPDDNHQGSPDSAGLAQFTDQGTKRPNQPHKATHSALSSQRANTASEHAMAAETQMRQRAERDLTLYFEAHPVEDSVRERLLNAVVETQRADSDIKEAGRQQGLGFPEISKLRDEEYDKFRANITDILGPEEAKNFLFSRNASSFVPIAQDFANRCATAGEPLSPAATNAIAIDLSMNLRDPAYAKNQVMLPSGISASENQAMNSAANVLTPAQREVLKKLLSEHPYPKRGM